MKVLTSVLSVLTILLAVFSDAKACQMGNYDAIIDPAEKPSIFKPQQYQLAPILSASIPKIPGVSEIPKIPGVPEIPKIPGVPEVPKIPGVPEIPKIPGVPDIPKIPGLPNIPGISDLITRKVCQLVKCIPSAAKYQLCRCVYSE